MEDIKKGLKFKTIYNRIYTLGNFNKVRLIEDNSDILVEIIDADNYVVSDLDLNHVISLFKTKEWQTV